MSMQTTTKRTTQKPGMGVKLFIMAASLATTIGGWGILALNQTQDAIASAQPPQASTQSVTSNSAQSNTRSTTNSNNSTTTLRQVNPSIIAPRAAARTRSSR